MSESKVKAMAEYPFRPGVPEYGSGMLDRITDNVWKVNIAPDPLGPVNKIITLLRNGEPVTSVLYPVNEGDSVRLVRDESATTIQSTFLRENEIWDGFIRTSTGKMAGWRVEINGVTVLSVTDAELRPTPPPAPRIPLWRRMWQALLDQARADADAIAGWLGYHRNDDRWDY